MILILSFHALFMTSDSVRDNLKNIYQINGGFRWGKRTPLVFLRHSFWLIDPEILLKVPWAPIYTHFEAERAPKNSDFGKNFPKRAEKRPFWPVFFPTGENPTRNPFFFVENPLLPQEHPRSVPVSDLTRNWFDCSNRGVHFWRITLMLNVKYDRQCSEQVLQVALHSCS